MRYGFRVVAWPSTLVLMAAMSDVAPEQSGLASGITNTLTGGYHLAFLIGALFAVAAAVIGAALLRTRHLPTAPAHEPSGAPAPALDIA